MGYSGARGTLIYEKIWCRKSRIRLPLMKNLSVLYMCFSLKNCSNLPLKSKFIILVFSGPMQNNITFHTDQHKIQKKTILVYTSIYIWERKGERFLLISSVTSPLPPERAQNSPERTWTENSQVGQIAMKIAIVVTLGNSDILTPRMMSDIKI
jgi:hypothetical protein